MFVVLKGTEVLRIQTLGNMSYTLFVTIQFHFIFISKFTSMSSQSKITLISKGINQNNLYDLHTNYH